MANHHDLDVARTLLARLGITPQELIHDPPAERRRPPTFAEFVPTVAALVSSGTRKCYGPYWNKVLAVWGDRRLDEPLPSEIIALAETVKATTVTRRTNRGGLSAVEHLIGALRCLYKIASADGLIDPVDDPSQKVKKPKRPDPTRRGLDNDLVHRIVEIAGTTGNDPALDALLIRLHIETAARRGGALALRLRDLDRDQCLVHLHEKGDTTRWQPVSPTLMTRLFDHAHHRGVVEPDSQLLRYHNGNPLTYRRYDHLWQRIGRYVGSVHAQAISTHWLRHTTLTWVERHFGYATAQAYAGHSSTNDHHGTTATYVRAGLREVVVALSALTAEPHPLAATDLHKTDFSQH